MRVSKRSKFSIGRRVVAVATAAALAMPSFSNSLTAGPLVGSTDFGLFGISGLRGTGTGTITVTGVTGTVTRAVLVWHGLASTTTALTRGGSIGGTPFTGTNIGLSSDNCWGQASSQAFQADVTSSVTGNGSYVLSNMLTSGTFDPNGASLLVFYNDGNSTNNRDIAVFWGNDSNQVNTFDPAGWSATLSGINYTSGAATLNVIVSDGQNFGETGTNTLTVNSTPITYPLFQGASLPVAPGTTVSNGGLWDHASASVASVLVPGPNTLTVTGNPEGNGDCLSLVGAIFDLPGGTVTPPVAAAPAVGVPTLSALGLGGMSLSAALWGLYGLRNRRRDQDIDGAENTATK
jgi:hypothetical protein